MSQAPARPTVGREGRERERGSSQLLFSSTHERFGELDAVRRPHRRPHRRPLALRLHRPPWRAALTAARSRTIRAADQRQPVARTAGGAAGAWALKESHVSLSNAPSSSLAQKDTTPARSAAFSIPASAAVRQAGPWSGGCPAGARDSAAPPAQAARREAHGWKWLASQHALSEQIDEPCWRSI